MPKDVFKIEQFHGGLNTSADPRDILDSEVSDITNGMVDQVGVIRSFGSVVDHEAPILNLTGTGMNEVPGAGLFYFAHDRTGAEDSGDSEAESGDSYLALYDDDDAQVWVYSLAGDTWNDDKDDNHVGVINTKGKGTSGAARPSFNSIDGSVRLSTGEFSKYASGSLINDGSHFLSTDTTLTVDDGNHFVVGNYLQIGDEIIYVISKSTNDLTVRRAMFGTKAVQHDNNATVYIINLNQWYGYINSKFFQNSSGVPEYSSSKWYNTLQHLRSFDELGITLATDDSSAASPSASELVANKIILAYWMSDDGFWSGSYWLGMTPVYEGNQEGPISTVGSDPIQLNEEILNIQLYITHPDIDDTAIVEGDGHPLLDERIIGLRLYTKQYTSDEWFLLKEFDLLEGGEHGWETYNSSVGSAINPDGGSTGNTLTGFWKTTSTADSLSVAAPSATESYDGKNESNTCTVTLNLEESKGPNRVGVIRLSGFENSPLYKEVDLNNLDAQSRAFNVINPASGTHKFVAHLLDENFNIMARAEVQQLISDSGVDAPPPGEWVDTRGSS